MERNVSIIDDLDGGKIVIINDIIFKGRQRIEWPEVEKRFNVFQAVLLIRHAQDGKLYLYDLVNIKKETGKPLEQ